LKNIEETEKAKRVVAEERQERRKAVANDEEHLVATRFYRPNLKAKSDADILRDAKLEAMGLPPQDDMPKKSHYEKPQMATDELVSSASILFYQQKNVRYKREFHRLWNASRRECENDDNSLLIV